MQNCEALSNEVSKLRETIILLKKSIRAQSEAIAEKEAAIGEARDEAVVREQELRSRWDSERQLLVDSHDAAIAKLRDHCEMQRTDIEKLAQNASVLDRKLQAAQDAIAELRRAKLRAESDLKDALEQADRDIQLATVSAQLAVQGAESECAARINEERVECEKAKKRIIGFVADAFRQHFDPHERLDERAVRQVLARAKDELAAFVALDSAVRKIAGAAQHQRTDDAVAQACLGSDSQT
jgi:chromosome segregation ATPase